MTVWVVLSAASVRDKVSEAVDGGDIASAIRLASSLDAFIAKLKNFCQTNGGSLVLALYERCIMSLPMTAAEQIPLLVTEYTNDLHGGLAVGVGMNVFEATTAAKMSCWTHEIEMYDPAKDYDGVMMKAEHMQVDPGANLFDPELPDMNDKTKLEPFDQKVHPAKTYLQAKKTKPPPVLAPDANTANQMSNQLIQSNMAEIGFNPQPPQMPQQAQGQPRDLLESLHGQQIQGYQPPMPPEQEQQQQQAQGGGEQDSESKLTGEIDVAEQEAQATNKKLAGLLAHVREQVPAIMQLHDTNPKAFKQAMNVVGKLITLASQRQRTTKSETLDKASEQLEKALKRRQASYHAPKGGRTAHSYPIGTRIGRKRKVLVNGKAAWRGLESGQVKDASGPLSVKEANKQSDPTKQ